MTLTDVGHDLHYGLRRLRAAPAFTLLATVTLALGIAAATTIFSVIETVLLNPFPYRDAEHILVFQIRDPANPRRSDRSWFMNAELAQFRTDVTVLDDVVVIEANREVILTTSGGSRRLNGALVSSGTFPFFGVGALVGRTPGPQDSRPGAEPVFVMSHRMWAEQYGLASDIIGRTFALNGVPTTLVGIMPPRFKLMEADLWQPSLESAPGTPDAFYNLFARLKTGVSVQQAEAQFRVAVDRLAPRFPRLYGKTYVVKAVTLVDSQVGPLRATLYIFAAAVGLLLLIACGNVANMLLARATTREREMAIRASIGGSRLRLVRQLFTESVLLALLGGLAGVGLAYACLRVVVVLVPATLLPAEAVIALNGSALLFSLVVSVATALVFGILPASQATRHDLIALLRSAGKETSDSFRGERMRTALVVVEVALSIVLLAGAGLLVRSYINLHRIDLGLRADDLIFARIKLPEGQYQSAAAKNDLVNQVVARVQSLPGIAGAAAASAIPLGGGIRTGIAVPGRPLDATASALVQLCTSSYFPTTGIRLRRGRFFSEAEVAAGRQVAVVNETLARQYFGDSDPIGRLITLNVFETFRDGRLADPRFEVVGVVADVKHRGPRESSWPEAYAPSSVSWAFGRSIVVRAADVRTPVIGSIRSAIWAVDRNLVITETGTVDDMLTQYSYSEPRFSLAVLSAFALVGLVLVTLGVYGAIAYTVARQTRAIGIRMALGARPSDVRGMVVTKTLGMIAAGGVFGVLAALLGTRVLTTQLWGVTSNDPATLGVVVALVVAVGLAAGYFPARRATRVDPMVALRYE